MTDVDLRPRVALVRSQAEQARPLSVVLWYTTTMHAQDTEVALGFRVALVCSFAVPHSRLRVVLHDAFTRRIHMAKSNLRINVPLARSRPQPSNSNSRVALHT